MNQKALNALEYPKIIEKLTDKASSYMGKQLCKNLEPSTDLEEIRLMQIQTKDALTRLFQKGSVSFGSVKDIRGSLKRLEIGSSLGIQEILAICALLENTSRVKAYSRKERNDLPVDSLDGMFDALSPLTPLSAEIRRCIISEDEFSDDASPALRQIRRNMKITNDRIHTQLASLVNGGARTYLQDSVITMRNGRYCIPVKQEYRSKFPGMIHDQSSTGSTLFIEPMAVVNLNNQIKELANEELLEIEKILESLSAQAATYVSEIAYDLELLTDLDFIFAKAKFARATNSTRPIFNTDGIIDIRQGRHPLLEKHTVVPVDIRLGETYNLLIITGPNTGGKTVSLKTLGLFSLMGQAGLHIPAMEESRLAVFDDIFADIGDEQSIEQNLSTFSSHMSNIVYIVQHATPNTLCLFDEPGGGTDPVEGAALAVSILNYLKSMGARCMATTHYSELKTYALSTDGVENASCEFDVATLRPTYRLTIGIPGKSNAFAIASKLGLPDYIINSAKDQIDSDAIDMETLLADLEASKRSMQEDEKAIEAYKQEIESLKESLQKKEENLDTKKAEILKKAREEARDIIDDAKDVADQTIRDYNKWRNNPHKADMRTMEEQRSKLRSKIKDYEKSGASETKKQTSNHKASDFHIGDTVQVLSMGTRGTITKLPDNKGIAGVQMGILNSMLPISDLLIIPESTVSVNGTKQKYSGKHAGGDHTSVSKSMTFSPELNVMGKTVDEACFEIDKYLDDAVLAHISRVTIIHGKGTGALRKGIWQYLKKHPLVQSYRSGEFGEGEYGVTIVEL
mgnify:CR=1 FL=1